jgi:2-dehydropantoate 2-reductase
MGSSKVGGLRKVCEIWKPLDDSPVASLSLYPQGAKARTKLVNHFQVLNSIPNVAKEGLPPFDFIITTTKNCPDIPPTLQSIISPAVTPSHTVIVMIQNGLNIEKATFASFPTNIVFSGVSMIEAHEGVPGTIHHEWHDELYLGPFHNPSLPQNHPTEISAAKTFINIYNAAGKSTVHFQEDVQWGRWRKLIFNAALNPICAITGLDDGRIRLAHGAVEGLVKPAMKEIYETAKELGYVLPDDIMDTMLNMDPLDLYLKPSMQVDIEKVCESFTRKLHKGDADFIRGITWNLSIWWGSH